MAKKDEARLGKGLSAIFGQDVSDVLEEIQQGKNETFVTGQLNVPVKDIRPNPYQPRKEFDEEKITELADSIRLHGVFTPILIKKGVKGYDLIAGERRLRASKEAGLKEIPAILVDFNDKEMMEIALLENIQREDLNAIEEALALENTMKKLSYTQEEMAQRIGKSREYVANLLRLLKLPKKVQQYVLDGTLSTGHVRALLGLGSQEEMELVAKETIQKGLSVREVEKLVKSMKEPKEKTTKQTKETNVHYDAVASMIQSKLQTKVKIKDKQLSVYFENDDDLNRVLELLGFLEEEL